MKEIITSTNRKRAMDLVRFVFLLVIDHENVIRSRILGVFGRKNRRYCEHMDN